MSEPEKTVPTRMKDSMPIKTKDPMSKDPMSKDPMSKDTKTEIDYQKNPLIYFLPPVTNTFMLWGESLTVILFVFLLFVIIILLYIYININSYKNNINLMSNAYLFGYVPQDEFVKYIKNAQYEAISSAMNNIQTNTENINTNANRLGDNTTRLNRQISKDIMNKTNQNTTQIGNEAKSSIDKLLTGIQSSLEKFNISRFVQGNTVTTTQSPTSYPTASSGPTPSSGPMPSSGPRRSSGP
jgi:hypothetical protein